MILIARRRVNPLMRRIVKFLHTVSACGLIGALLGHMLVLWQGPQATPEQYAALREIIALISRYILVPSLALSLVSGLIAMIVHRPYLERRWAWAKAALGLSMFEATLAVTQSKSVAAADLSARIAHGIEVEQTQRLLAEAIRSEWNVLYAILALSLAQMALGIWRPKLDFKRAEP
jgi:Predicted integral membrane protein (DUF2269)